MMITRLDLIATCLGESRGEEVDRAHAEFLKVDGTRMYVSAEEEFATRKTSLPPLFALERLRGHVDGSKRGELASIVLCAFYEGGTMIDGIPRVVRAVHACAPRQKAPTRIYAAELVADALLLASEFAAAWNRSKLKEVP